MDALSVAGVRGGRRRCCLMAHALVDVPLRVRGGCGELCSAAQAY